MQHFKITFARCLSRSSTVKVSSELAMQIAHKYGRIPMNLHSDVPSKEDLPHDPQPVAHWSESYAFWAWDHQNDLTVYGHFQRHPEKPIIWRGYCTVMKGDQVYVLHSYGRQRSPFGPGFEAGHMIIEQP